MKREVIHSMIYLHLQANRNKIAIISSVGSFFLYQIRYTFHFGALSLSLWKDRSGSFEGWLGSFWLALVFELLYILLQRSI